MKEKKEEREAYAEELVAFVEAEYERRREERAPLERQWELNLNFLAGRQYMGLSSRGELVEDGKAFFWQSRGVFNHIAPIAESRIAKLGKIDPVLRVRARSGGDGEVNGAKLSERLLSGAMERLEVRRTVAETTAWSETCGTGFYRIGWDESGKNGGDVYVECVPPFEIYPDSPAAGAERAKSVIRARVADADELSAVYGKAVSGKEEETVSPTGEKRTVKNAVTLLEYYERQSARAPQGKYIVTAGGALLFSGALPYENGENGKRELPFVRQVSVEVTGSFFGQSVIERLIPVQRAFNAVKNRKHEFINRLSMGVMNVEDGSVDTEELAEEGLSPGRILVYRQGAKPPEMLDMGAVPANFAEEEKSLLNEFTVISGVSDVASSSANATVSSGTALELLIEQDNERLTASAERIRECYKKIAKHILRLYRQFTSGAREFAARAGEKLSSVRIEKKDVRDDVVIENENELLYGEGHKKELLLQMYSSGLLAEEDGTVRADTKERLLSLLGYGDLAGDRGMSRLHAEKAKAENLRLAAREVKADGYDDHAVHIEEHVRYVLGEDESLSPAEKARFEKHVAEHKKKLAEERTQ